MMTRASVAVSLVLVVRGVTAVCPTSTTSATLVVSKYIAMLGFTFTPGMRVFWLQLIMK